MATNVRSTYTNLMKIQIDKTSVNRTRKQVKNFAKEIQDLYNKIKIPSPLAIPNAPRAPRSPTGTGSGPRAPLQDAHARQKKMVEQQENMIDNYMVSNRLVNQMSSVEKDLLRTKLLQQESVKATRIEIRKHRLELQEKYRTNKRIEQSLKNQNLLQKRLTSSATQMAGALGSTYVLMNAGQAAVRTGMDFEAIEKSFLVVSGGAENAAENMKFAREEAMRLGTPLVEVSKSFSRMLAAAGNKMEIGALKDIFIGVNESAVALGLTQDQVSKIMLATQQMMSKNKVMAKLWPLV